MSGVSAKRILKEIEDLKKLNLLNVKEINHPDDSNIFNTVIFLSNFSHPFDDGNFKLDIIFPKDYPFSVPECVMRTKIYHPNIDHKGNVCLGELAENWHPVNTLSSIMSYIIDLINSPNPDNSLSPDIAKAYKENKKAYLTTAKTWTSIYAQ